MSATTAKTLSVPTQMFDDFGLAVAEFSKSVANFKRADLTVLSKSAAESDHDLEIPIPVSAIWRMIEVHEALESFHSNAKMTSRLSELDVHAVLTEQVV